MSSTAASPSRNATWAIPLIFALMGAFFWAIRGTGGFGGMGGALLAGLGWAMLWYALSRRDGLERHRPYGALRVIAALSLGIGVGGLTGYGVYTAWVQGVFYLHYPDVSRPVGAWTGYLALAFCGLHWGGNAGAFLAWCAPSKPLTGRDWVARIGAGITGAVLALLLVRQVPQIFLPFYREGIYTEGDRAVGSLHNIATHVGLFLGFLAFEAVRRDWRAVRLMTLLAGGFALAFSAGAYWHTFNGNALALDWWKHWEMSVGFGGGLALGLAFVHLNGPERTPQRPTPTGLERALGAALPIALITTSIVSNTWEGFVKLHTLDWPASYRTGTTVLYLLPVALALFLWHRSNTADLPRWTPAAVLALILTAGYLVSIPDTPALANKELLTLYTTYLLSSAALYVIVLRPTRNR